MPNNTTPDILQTQPISLVDNTNPLRQFRSYSYHFIMVACESTLVLDYLSSPAATNSFERKLNGVTDPRNPKTNIITAKDGNGKTIGNYVIVIDTRQDVDFVIEDVQWGTTFVGDENSSKSSVALNVVMTDGVINIMEPRGVNFLNVLADLGDQLDVDMICMPFCLKTLFYGHKETGQVIPLNTTVPLGFIPVDIQGTIDERGTTYKMDICGVTNGVVHNPSYNAIVDNMSFPVTKGQTLAQHLDTFTKKINDTYTQQRNIVLNETKNTIDLSASATVNYQIKLEPNSIWLQKLTDFGTNQPDQLTVEDGKHIIKGTKEGGIPEVILKLLTSSQQWVKVAAQGNPPDTINAENISGRFTFNVTQTFTSSSPSISQSQITVYIYVSEYRYDTVEVVSTPGGQQTQIPPPTINPNKVITFDYIFTGKNIDILGMEINLSMGLALLQTLSTAKAMVSQAEDATGGNARLPSTFSAASPAAGPLNKKGKVRKGTPIFAPLQWAVGYLKEMKEIQSTGTADAIWKNFASYQSVNTIVNIHGNPLILAKLIDPNRSTPNYVKINIKMPKTSNDIWEYPLLDNQTPGGYYKDFWYTGYYIIVSAVNKFSDGLFTQELDLVSLPQVSSTQGVTSAIDAALDNIENARDHFFNTTSTTPSVTNKTPTGSVTSPLSSSSGGQLATPGQNPASPTHQAFVANYWNSALQSSQTTGINPDFTLAQSAVETNWGTNRLSQQYSSFFNVRSYNTTPNQYWGGTIIPGTNSSGDPAFRAYSAPVNSWLDQGRWISSLYPISNTATDINTYANGLLNGRGNRKWTSTDQTTYVSNIINAYNHIQTYKTNLGIQPNQYYAGSPIPTPISTTSNYLAVNTPVSSSSSTNSSTLTTYATTRTVTQAAIAQKATVFPTS